MNTTTAGKKVITRAEYMNDSEKLHDAYYEQIGEEAGISYAESVDLPRIITALKTGDEHLNRIPLGEWDLKAHWTKSAIDRAMRKRGDFWSLAGSVCVHKAMARKAGLAS